MDPLLTVLSSAYPDAILYTRSDKSFRSPATSILTAPGVSPTISQRLAIAPDADGFLLLHFTEDGKDFADTWHPTIADAKEQAAFEVDAENDHWLQFQSAAIG